MKMKNKALFLDRDGIINVDKNYVYRIDDIEFCEGIFELVAWANQNHYLVIVLTNQSGIERGYYTESDMLKLHEWMNQQFIDKGLRIEDWFYCKELDSDRRKPRPGMMLEAEHKYNIDLKQSIMIGDRPSDVLHLEGPEYLLVQGQYDLQSVTVKKFDQLNEVLQYLTSRFS